MLQKELTRELQDLCIWVVELSNGDTVFQNDSHGYSTWIELRQFCLDEKVGIVKLYVRFRTERVHIDISDGQAIYFAKGVSKDIDDENTSSFYTFGLWKDGLARVRKFSTPDLSELPPEAHPREILPENDHLIPTG